MCFARRMFPLDSRSNLLIFILITCKVYRSVYSPPIALCNASNKAPSLKGLNRHSIAPSSSNRDRTTSSLRAVMKTTGILRLRRRSSRKSSGPDITGIATSRTSPFESRGASDAKNSRADENARESNPNSLSSSGNDSRTDWSSSTTEINNRVLIKKLTRHT
jgi:hypothetical protein